MTIASDAHFGVVMVATGESYLTMACNAAESVKRHTPSLPIHLYTDTDVVAQCFDHVTRLDQPWRRSKIDAMISAPFERNLFLDADLFVVADISDVFKLLDRFDIALAHDQERNSPHGRATWRMGLPACFPQFNSGVVAYRRSEAVLAVMRAWRAAVRDGDLQRDQGALRELLWNSDLRIATLPPEYNLADLSSILRLSGASLAPRIIHHYAIHRAPPHGVPNSVEALHGRAVAAAIRFMQRRDRTLEHEAPSPVSMVPDILFKRFLQVLMFVELGARRTVGRWVGLFRRSRAR